MGRLTLCQRKRSVIFLDVIVLYFDIDSHVTQFVCCLVVDAF